MKEGVEWWKIGIAKKKINCLQDLNQEEFVNKQRAAYITKIFKRISRIYTEKRKGNMRIILLKWRKNWFYVLNKWEMA